MRRRRLTVLLVASIAALSLVTAAEASNGPIGIGFEKDCPELTCEETAGSPVDVNTVVTPVAFGGGVLRYTATETLSSASGSVTLSLAGILNLNTDPDFTVLHGSVASGSWNGVNLVGARVHASAIRVAGTTFVGSVTILPGSAE